MQMNALIFNTNPFFLEENAAGLLTSRFLVTLLLGKSFLQELCWYVYLISYVYS